MIEAGFHLIQGGDDMRGADLIAQVASDSVACRLALADLNTTGTALEAALKVYRQQRRTPRERLPLLAALAQAGYYEDRRWGELYGDEALDVLEDSPGLRAGRSGCGASSAAASGSRSASASRYRALRAHAAQRAAFTRSAKP